MKIAIVGDSMSTRHEAPFADQGWEIWGLGNGFRHMPRMDRYFELHGMRAVRQGINLSQFYIRPTEIGAQRVHINAEIEDHFRRRDDGTPSVEPFPFEALLTEYPRRMFTSSIAWLVGFAAHEGATTIGIWGADMMTSSEYAPQHAGVAYMIGLLEGRGIEIYIPPASFLLRAPFQYALEEDADRRFRSAITDQKTVLIRELRLHQKRHFDAQRGLEQLVVRLEENEESLKRGADPVETAERIRLTKVDIEARQRELSITTISVVSLTSRVDECAHFERQFTYADYIPVDPVCSEPMVVSSEGEILPCENIARKVVEGVPFCDAHAENRVAEMIANVSESFEPIMRDI